MICGLLLLVSGGIWCWFYGLLVVFVCLYWLVCLAIVVLRVSYMFALGMGGGYSSGCGWVVVWAFRWFVCLLCCVVMVCVWSIDLGLCGFVVVFMLWAWLVVVLR